MASRWQRCKDKVFDMLEGMGGLAVRMDPPPPNNIETTHIYHPEQKGSQVSGTTIAPHPQIVADMMIKTGLRQPGDWHTHSVGIDGHVVFRQMDSINVYGVEQDGELVLRLTDVLEKYRYAQYRMMYRLLETDPPTGLYIITLLIFSND